MGVYETEGRSRARGRPHSRLGVPQKTSRVGGSVLQGWKGRRVCARWHRAKRSPELATKLGLHQAALNIVECAVHYDEPPVQLAVVYDRGLLGTLRVLGLVLRRRCTPHGVQ